MAIMTDLMITIDSGYDEPKYGVSKALSNYTLDEIWSSCYVGANLPVHRMISKSFGEAARYWSNATTRPYTIGSLIYQWGMYIGARIASSGAVDDDEYAEDGIYTKTIWLYSASSLPQTITDLSSVRMVTQMDFTRFKLHFERSTGQSTGEGGVVWGDDKSYGTIKSNSYLLDNSDPNNPVWKNSGNITLIKPYQMVKIDDKYCLIDALTTGYYANYLGGFDGDTAKEVVTGFSSIDNSLKFGLLQSLKKTSDSYGEIRWYENSWAVNYPSMYDNYKAYMQNRSTSQGYNQTVVYPTSQDEFQKNIMGYGVYFETDRTYKPIITDGYVTGYTADLTAASELDGYTGSAIHVVPDTKPSGGGGGGTDEDNDDPIPVAGAPYSSGLARYYATTAGSLILQHISEAMGAWNLKDSGKDLYKNIISCKLIKSPAPIPVSGSEPFTVYGVKLQYEGADITLPVINDNPTASFGSYNIPRKFNDFRDYAPYTKVEIYLPYCGWTVLPSHVVGRSVSVTYYTDIIAATCKAVVYCGSNIVAEAAGVIGLDIPMVTENAGAKAEAVTMGLLAYGKAGLQTALGVGAAVASKGKVGVKSAVGGLENLVSAYSQTAMAFNQNYTEINGKNGDGCSIAGITAIVIKITRPKYGSNSTPPYVPSEYGHSTGFVSMKSAKVGSFTGLLVADNVDTSGISGATDREKQLIKLYLESGVFVNHPN